MKAGWEKKRLPDIAEYFIGLTYTPKDVGSSGTIVLRSSNVQNDELDLSDLVRVTCSVKKPLHVRKGDILMCSRNGSKRLVGKSAVIGDLPEEMTFGTFMTVIRSERNPYLSWFFRSEAFRDQIGVGENTMINQITKYMLDAIQVPIPPLPEQHRIVAILDEAFDGIATAKANAEKSLQNAHALFESHLQSVFTGRGESWEEKELGDVCELFQGLCINAKTKHLLVEKSSLPLLRIKDLRTNSAEQFVAETGWPQNAKVDESEIIYTRTGQIGLVFRGREGILHNNCFKVKPKPSLNSDYLFWWLQNPMFRTRITTLASKAAQPDITHALFKVQPILIPPRDYQDKAIELIDVISRETKRLESLYQQKLTALDDLKNSLLHQAFSGII